MSYGSIKIVKKPTPIRNAVLCVSLTANLALALTAYGMYNGNISRTVPYDVAEIARQKATQEVVLNDEHDMDIAFDLNKKHGK